MRLPESARGRSPGTQGMALISALLVLTVGLLIGISFCLSTQLAESLAANEGCRHSARAVAFSGYSLAAADLSALAEASPEFSWDQLFQGEDGVVSCSGSFSAENLNPLDPVDAWKTPIGVLRNRCWDDGTLGGLSGLPYRMGPEGWLVYPVTGGGFSFGSGGLAGGQDLVGHLWIRISDNREPDGNIYKDTDGKAVLRVLAAVRGAVFDVPGRTAARNSVAALEAWLAHSKDSAFRVLSLRQVAF